MGTQLDVVKGWRSLLLKSNELWGGRGGRGATSWEMEATSWERDARGIVHRVGSSHSFRSHDIFKPHKIKSRDELLAIFFPSQKKGLLAEGFCTRGSR